MMTDRPTLNESETQAREALVRLAAAMLDGRLSFFEGAVEVPRLKSAVGGVPDFDPHFDAFVVIASESDHLPRKAQQHLWSIEAIAELQPDFERTERWAATFAPSACRGLIERFARCCP
jgi:hypothetical protein